MKMYHKDVVVGAYKMKRTLGEIIDFELGGCYLDYIKSNGSEHTLKTLKKRFQEVRD